MSEGKEQNRKLWKERCQQRRSDCSSSEPIGIEGRVSESCKSIDDSESNYYGE